ncbi:MAG: DNA gyrase inhibitor YacG [Thermoguttaceae bacterium]
MRSKNMISEESSPRTLNKAKFATATCPVCEKSFDTVAEEVALPFCSKRCKLIDRARWLGEEYGLPYESENSPEITELETD